MATSHLYTDLSIYYDRFCQDIPYAHQANTLKRLEALFNESCGQHYLDIACGTGQLMEQAQKFGWQMSGLDNAQAMLTRASSRCPEASWILADMVQIPAKPQYNFASCLLYSMHYTGSLKRLRGLFQAVWQALVPGGFGCLIVWINAALIILPVLQPIIVTAMSSLRFFPLGLSRRGQPSKSQARHRINNPAAESCLAG